MRIIVKIREKKPIEEYTKHMREHLESRFEDITNVRSAEFDTRTGKIYIEYVDPAATEDDDRSDSIDTGAFRNAVNLTEWFTFVGISV